MSEDPTQDKTEFWAAQAMMWHDKYKQAMALEVDCHRYRVALQKLATGSNEGLTKERVRLIARRALENVNG